MWVCTLKIHILTSTESFANKMQTLWLREMLYMLAINKIRCWTLWVMPTDSFPLHHWGSLSVILQMNCFSVTSHFRCFWLLLSVIHFPSLSISPIRHTKFLHTTFPLQPWCSQDAIMRWCADPLGNVTLSLLTATLSNRYTCTNTNNHK